MIKYLKKVGFATVVTPIAIIGSTIGALAMWVAVVICKDDELNAFFARMKNKK